MLVEFQPSLRYYTGLDLGGPSEFSAVAVLEQTRLRDSATGKTLKHYAVRHLKRYPPGTPYTEMRSQLAPRFAEPPLAGSNLVIDQTMAGRSVYLMFRRPAIDAAARALTVTGGHSKGDDGFGGYLVPKKDLVGNLQVLLQARRL